MILRVRKGCIFQTRGPAADSSWKVLGLSATVSTWSFFDGSSSRFGCTNFHCDSILSKVINEGSSLLADFTCPRKMATSILCVSYDKTRPSPSVWDLLSGKHHMTVSIAVRIIGIQTWIHQAPTTDHDGLESETKGHSSEPPSAAEALIEVARLVKGSRANY